MIGKEIVDKIECPHCGEEHKLTECECYPDEQSTVGDEERMRIEYARAQELATLKGVLKEAYEYKGLNLDLMLFIGLLKAKIKEVEK